MMTNEQFERAILVAGKIAFTHLDAAHVRDVTLEMCNQKAREATDRFKTAIEADRRNPTIQELADNAFLQFADRVPDFGILDAYTAECLTADREFRQQEGLQRR